MTLPRRILSVPVILALTLATARAATYFVDSGSGADTNSGVSARQAWRSLERVNQTVFQPGDVIRFKAGSRYAGRLAPQGSGTEARPIRIGKYGRGQLPRIDAEGGQPDALLLRNVEFWEVGDLELTNLGSEREPWRTGARICADHFGPMRHVLLTNLYVHDVNGDLRKSHEGCGIFFESRGRGAAWFEGLRIEGCRVARTDRIGICQRGAGGSRSTGVVLRDNLLEDIGGDAIKIWGSNGALVERNVVRGGRARCEDAAAGIWPFDSDDTLIQFNEVSGMKGTNDGQGFDSDYLCRRSVFQYNYSHDNEGGFMLVCSPGHSYNEGTVIRYNISQNDGINSARGVFHFGGGTAHTLVYNNTIYVAPGQNLPLVHCTEWDQGHARNARFFNNIFYADGTVTYEWGQSQDISFSHNVFYGHHVQPPADPHASTAQPALIKPGSGGIGLASLHGYRIQNPSLVPAGLLFPNHGGRDFFGRPVPQSTPPKAGACQD
jgi:hypothetical protein